MTDTIVSTMIEIPIDKLVPDPDNCRKWQSDEADKKLMHSILALGLIQPITVRPARHDGYHQIVVGHRRWMACKAAGLQTITAIISNDDAAKQAAQQLAENDVRLNLRLPDVWRAVDRLTRLGWQVESIATAFSMPERHVRRLQLLSDLPDCLIDYMRETGDIPNDHHMKLLVAAPVAVLEVASKAMLEHHDRTYHFPWHELVRRVTPRRISLEHALFDYSATDIAEAIDSRIDLFEPGTHPGYAYNIGEFWSYQNAEVNRLLADYQKMGFQIRHILAGDTVTAKAVEKEAPITIEYGTTKNKLKSIKKADRENYFVIARADPEGRVRFILAEGKPKPVHSTSSDDDAEPGAESEITAALDALILRAKRDRVAEMVQVIAGTMQPDLHSLLLITSYLLATRIGYHAYPKEAFIDGGKLATNLDDAGLARVAATIIGHALRSPSITDRDVARVGVSFDVVPYIDVDEAKLSMVKRSGLERIWSLWEMGNFPPRLKEARARLLDGNPEIRLSATQSDARPPVYSLDALAWSPLDRLAFLGSDATVADDDEDGQDGAEADDADASEDDA